MEALLFYLGKVIICSCVMFLYYQLSLKDRTFHHYNRFYLLSAMLISIFLPLIKVEDFTIEVSQNLYVLISKVQHFNEQKNFSNDHIYFRIIFSALGVVSLYFLGKFLFGIFRIQQLKSRFEKESFEGVNFYQTDLSEAPFSYFRNLFWKNSIVINSEVGKQILKHEMVHIEQKHSLDKIFIEIITAVFWFNPFFHIIRKEISLIHEYLADKKAVKKSDTKAFAQMLLASHFSGNQLPATSPFLSSNLKKRLKMLQKPKTKYGYARRIFALPVLFTVAFAYMVNAKNKEIQETNIEIDKAVAEIKKDTVAPKNEVEQIVKLQQEKIAKATEKLKEQSEKLKTLSEKSKEKAAELQKIAKEKGEKSYDFELKAKELKQLSQEMDKIADRDMQFQTDLEQLMATRNRILADKDANVILKDMNIKRIFPDGDHYSIKIHGEDGEDMALEKIFDSKAFKENSGLSEEKIKILKEKLDSPEFKFRIKRLDKNGLDTRLPAELARKFELSNSGFKILNDEIDRRIKEISKSQNFSKKDKRKFEKLAKEKAELAKKQAEIAKKQAELIKTELQNNPWIIDINAYAPKANINRLDSQGDLRIPQQRKILSENVYRSSAKELLGESSMDNVSVYIDGKPSSKEELRKLDPNSISSMSVNKSKNTGKETGTIHITTKDTK